MNRNLWMLLLAGLSIGVLLLWFMHDRDARRINQRLVQLTGAVEKHPGEGHLITLARSQEVVNFFTTDAIIVLRPLWSGELARRDLSALYYQVHSRAEQLTVQLSDKRLQIDRSAGTAKQRFTARGTIHLAGQRDQHLYEFELDWVKQDGEWLIRRAAIVQGIRAPGQ